MLRNRFIYKSDFDIRIFGNNNFTLGIDTERVIETGFTVLITRAGDVLKVHFKMLDG